MVIFMLNKLKTLFFGSNKLKKELCQRPPLATDIIFVELSSYNFNKSEFNTLWEKIGTAFHINPQKLRLTDRFDVELKALDPWPVDGYITELEDLLHQHKKNTSKSKKTLHTLKDYVVYFLSK